MSMGTSIDNMLDQRVDNLCKGCTDDHTKRQINDVSFKHPFNPFDIPSKSRGDSPWESGISLTEVSLGSMNHGIRPRNESIRPSSASKRLSGRNL